MVSAKKNKKRLNSEEKQCQHLCSQIVMAANIIYTMHSYFQCVLFQMQQYEKLMKLLSWKRPFQFVISASLPTVFSFAHCFVGIFSSLIKHSVLVRDFKAFVTVNMHFLFDPHLSCWDSKTVLLWWIFLFMFVDYYRPRFWNMFSKGSSCISPDLSTSN